MKYNFTKGERFGRLVFTGEMSLDRKFIFQCDCGKITNLKPYVIANGNTTSCGCYKKERMRLRAITHGDSKSVEYKTWKSVIWRCECANGSSWKNYGGRGIKICSRWRANYQNFLTDMGRKPSSAYTIDRIDVNGHYEPTNCRWATRSQQAFNRRFIQETAFGEKNHFCALCRQFKVNRHTVKWRMRIKGESLEAAIQHLQRQQP